MQALKAGVQRCSIQRITCTCSRLRSSNRTSNRVREAYAIRSHDLVESATQLDEAVVSLFFHLWKPRLDLSPEHTSHLAP